MGTKDMEVTLTARLDTSEISTDISAIEKLPVLLSNITVDTSSIVEQIQKAINTATGRASVRGGGSSSGKTGTARRISASVGNTAQHQIDIDNAKTQNKIKVLQAKQANDQAKHNNQIILENQKAANKAELEAKKQVGRENLESKRQQGRIETENVRQQHRLEIQEKRAQQRAEEQARLAAQRETEAIQRDAERSGIGANRISRHIDDRTYEARNRVVEAQRTPYKAQEETEEFQAVTASVNEAKEAYVELQRAQMAFHEGAIDSGEFTQTYDKYDKQITKAANDTKIFTTNQKELLTGAQIAKEQRSLAEYMTRNTKAVKAYAQEFVKLQDMSDNLRTTGDRNVYRDAFERVKTQAAQSGNTGRTFFDEIKRGFKQIGQFVGTYGVYQDLLQMAREMVQSVIDIDTAMTELRKVSDATGKQIDDYLSSATTHAKEYGAAVSDVVNATADWSRLGYSLPEADKLAQASLLYRNVGDNIDIDAANESLVSTLQGFQLTADDAVSIIDKFNEVGNNFPIDTAGIGEALSKSAASFQAANTSLSESIALVTAANEVVHLCLIA